MGAFRRVQTMCMRLVTQATHPTYLALFRAQARRFGRFWLSVLLCVLLLPFAVQFYISAGYGFIKKHGFYTHCHAVKKRAF